jgi:acetyltransferase-like isoleucine patch superfamily enzyme
MIETFIHAQAIVESEVGLGTRVWAFAHVLPGARVGKNCNLGDHTFLETGAVLGDNVTLKNHVCVWEGVTLEDDVFVGPHAAFVNDIYPRSPRMAEVRNRYLRKERWLVKTVLERGCSVGANATILGGLRLGRYSMIAAGATVTRDVEPFALMAGSPARRVGTVCICGRKLSGCAEALCSECRLDGEQVIASCAGRGGSK